MLEILIWIILGLIGGWIGFLATRNNDKDNIQLCLLVGVVSSLIIGFCARNLGKEDGQLYLNANSFVLSLVFSTILSLGAGWLKFRND